MSQAYATMNFFQRQQESRRKTFFIFLYLPFAIAFICGVFYLFVMAILWYDESDTSKFAFWDPLIFFWVSTSVLFVVGVATICNAIKLLQGGGVAVAAMFNAELVARNTTDPEERKLLNVVDEMAIAAGAPVPEVYIMRHEENINAFAAGLSMEQAVIVVTRGCMACLERDQLQGVIAHEFSHILNGDARLNIYLMALVSGLLVFTMIGYYAMEGGWFIGGVITICIGALGALLAQLIKSAVSRQREFLADASAVQFTRNPAGIAGALLKIANGSSDVSHFHTLEASHLFFADGMMGGFSNFFFGLLSSHPPITERIRRIAPASADLPATAPDEADRNVLWSNREAAFLSGTMQISPQSLVSSIGSPRPEHLLHAAQIRAALPEALVMAAVSPYSARALIYRLLISEDENIRIRQFNRLSRQGDMAIVELTGTLLAQSIPPEHRLPLVDMAMPSLKGLSLPQYQKFIENIEFLAQADAEISLFEYMLISIVKRRLDSLYLKKKRGTKNRASSDSVALSCRKLLSLLSWYGATDSLSAGRSYLMGIAALKLPAGDILSQDACEIKMLDGVVSTLASTPFDFQEQVLRACVLCISADMRVTVEEAELLRAVAESLGCPVPPLLPGLL